MNKPTPFTGNPVYRQSAKPSLASRIRNRTIHPSSGVDHLLFGLAPFIAPKANIYRRVE